MQQKTRLFFILFWLVTLADLLLTYFHQTELRWLSKPLLMPLLAIAFIVGSAKKKGQFFYCIIGALVFSWGGDVLLQLKGMFIPGLVLFLLAHVCYIFYFIKTGSGKQGLLQFQPMIGLPVLVYIVLFLSLLYPFLDALKIPVTVYGVTIAIMLLMAVNTKRKVKDDASSLFFNGALQFVISDSLLAVNLFAYPNLVLSLCVMITYCSAQYLIVKGALANQD